MLLTEDVELQGAQFAIGNDQEVAAAAGWIEESERGKALAEVVESGTATIGPVGSDRFKFCAEPIEKKRADHFENVAFTGVVGTNATTLLIRQYLLKERAEDCRRDARPIKSCTTQQGVSLVGVA